MRDIQLWRALRTRRFESDEILPELAALAELPLEQRLPFIGFLPSILDHRDPAVRKAAVAAMRGANGFVAVKAIHHALRDLDADVRVAALEPLRAAGKIDGSLWIHAIFHADPAIRLAALVGEMPVPWYALYLAADPDARNTAIACLENVTFPDYALPVIFEYARRGFVPPAVARKWVRTFSWSDCYGFLSRWNLRTPEAAADVLRLLDHPDAMNAAAAHPSSDSLDDLFTIMADCPDEETSAWLRGVFADVRNYEMRYQQRVLASLLVGAARSGAWLTVPDHPPGFDALTLFTTIEPKILQTESIPVAVRRRVIKGLYSLGTECPRVNDTTLKAILATDVCWKPGRELDLWAAGGVLHLAESQPYRKLVAWHGIAPIVKAFEADPDGSLPFLSLFDNSEHGRRYLIKELCLQPRANRARLLAILSRVVPADGLDFLENLDGQSAVDVFTHNETLTHPNAKPLNEKKALRVAGWLAPKILAGHLGTFLRAWLSLPDFEQSPLGQAILGHVARSSELHTFVQAVRGVDPAVQPRFLAAVNCCPGFPYDRERELAEALREHPEPDVRAWAVARLAGAAPRPKAKPSHESTHLRAGLCAQLAAEPARPHADHCLALLASHDEVADVAEQFARFAAADAAFSTLIDESMIEHWRGEMRLPVLGHAWLFRWDEHGAALAEHLRDMAGVEAFLRRAETFQSMPLRDRVWRAVLRVLESWRFAKKLGFDWTLSLLEWLPTRLAGPAGVHAARLLMFWKNLGAPPAASNLLLPSLVRNLIHSGPDARTILHPWIDMTGLGSPPPAPEEVAEPTEFEPPPPSRAEVLRISTDLDELVAATAEEGMTLTAFKRLEELGSPGIGRIVEKLFEPGHPRVFEGFFSVRVKTWGDAAPWGRIVEAMLTAPVEVRPLIAVCEGAFDRPSADQRILILERIQKLLPEATLEWSVVGSELLAKHGLASGEEVVLDLVMSRIDRATLTPALREMVWAKATDDADVLQRVALAHDAELYERAVDQLLGWTPSTPGLRQVLEKFLEIGTGRIRAVRLRVAEFLREHYRSPVVLPLLFEAHVPTDEEPEKYPDILVGQHGDTVASVATATLMLNLGEEHENRVLKLLDEKGVDVFGKSDAHQTLLTNSKHENVRKTCRDKMRPTMSRMVKLRRLADTFAWGVRIGRELTGKLYGIEMIPGGDNLGYTRFTENKLYITPMPILRGDMWGREVVRALILHEYGHHMYHRGVEPEAIWKEAQNEGLHQLLNLVSDEHLERNLRALDRHFGDQLKMLAAYAFQHTAREMPVDQLLTSLQGHAFDVLTGTQMGVAKREGCVAVSNGRLLMQMEKAGLSFARFMRALRMGLGNRHADPRVEMGLELFRGKFRKSDMRRLKTIAEKLREIFGAETEMLNSFGQDVALGADADELAEAAEGISNDEVQKEVQSSLEGRHPRRAGDDARGGKGLNLGPEEHFDEINTVKPMPYDPAEHAKYVEQVARPATRMRRFFDGLGLSMQKQRMRLTGKTFDKTRVRALVLKGDPRMLIARRIEQFTDLFLGIVIDCSGSMDHRANIEKAKLFATLLAEAAKGQKGVDVRLFGFTDQVIYDAGRADRCAVHGLRAGGGNNDAAGLWHAAQAARASKRKAKLLVMISDGSPTECTVEALRALVKKLTIRWKMCCAQVAVCALEHKCFDNYILLDVDNVEESVRQFGQVMVRLVQKAMRGG